MPAGSRNLGKEPNRLRAHLNNCGPPRSVLGAGLSLAALPTSRIEVWEWSGWFGFQWQFLVLIGSLLYYLFGAPHVVFRAVRAVRWCAHLGPSTNAIRRAVYPRRSDLKGVSGPARCLPKRPVTVACSSRDAHRRVAVKT